MNHLIILSGPGGSGKDAIIAKLLQYHELNLTKLVNSTSRQPRTGEREGIDYHFLTRHQFEQGIKQNQFLEYEIMATNNEYYGTDAKELERALDRSSVITKKMPGGSLVLKKHFGNRAIAIFVDAPDSELTGRMGDSARAAEFNLIKKRLAQAQLERGLKPQFDLCIDNPDGHLQETVETVKKYIKQSLSL